MKWPVNIEISMSAPNYCKENQPNNLWCHDTKVSSRIYKDRLCINLKYKIKSMSSPGTITITWSQIVNKIRLTTIKVFYFHTKELQMQTRATVSTRKCSLLLNDWEQVFLIDIVVMVRHDSTAQHHSTTPYSHRSMK